MINNYPLVIFITPIIIIQNWVVLPLDWQLQGCLTASSRALNSFGCPQMHQLTSIHPIIEKNWDWTFQTFKKWFFFAFFSPIFVGNPPQEFSSSLGAPRATAGRAAGVASRGGGAKVGRHWDPRCFGHRTLEEDCPGGFTGRQGSVHCVHVVTTLSWNYGPGKWRMTSDHMTSRNWRMSGRIRYPSISINIPYNSIIPSW